MSATPVPPSIREYLVELVRLRFTGKDPEAVVAALPEAMEEGTVQPLASGGPFGWMISARLDEVDGRLVLEALEDDRMSGPSHYRVWEDGTVEALPGERSGFSSPPGASDEEIEQAQRALDAHNRAVAESLRQRGFR